MQVNETQVFNLWDTNGRRADVLNAIEIYLKILVELRKDYPEEMWESYPNSLMQYRFYQKALEASPEVFKSHGKYDAFIEEVKEAALEHRQLTEVQKGELDKNIEARARHYTSNLERLGFADVKRNISPAGSAFLNGEALRDPIEELLPIDDTNLLILRQLLKFRTYTKMAHHTEKRMSYSPMFMALLILLSEDEVGRFDKNDFLSMVQSLTPYQVVSPKEVMAACKEGDYKFADRSVDIPLPFQTESLIPREQFLKYISNSKSAEYANRCYYEFYFSLYQYRKLPNNENYEHLKTICTEEDAKGTLKQAFGKGKQVFDFGRLASYDHKTFREKNKNSPYLKTNSFNKAFYKEYTRSKQYDQARENSDTTARLFSASGVISLSKALPELINKDIFEKIFDVDQLEETVFAEVSEDAFKEKSKQFEDNLTLCEIMGYSDEKVDAIIRTIADMLGGSAADIKGKLVSRRIYQFVFHINRKYPKETVISLLEDFSAPSKGAKARDTVNPSCSIPTAYEYLVALAWYYISDEPYDIYGSLNLTMNADFEPERFAPGGAGDIVAKYEDKVVMIEVTMMNALAQKRGEWEPVLRHATNLTVEEAPKKVYTIFVADELDANTINIWRAVAMVPLKATNSEEYASRVTIMPLSNREVVGLLKQGTSSTTVLSAVEESFGRLRNDFDFSWREKILTNI